MGTVKHETNARQKSSHDRDWNPNGNRTSLMRMNAVERDPFNTAVAAELTDLVEKAQTGIVRLSRLTGIPRGSLKRYLDGERDIKVAELRKIADALNAPLADILAKAERSIQ